MANTEIVQAVRVLRYAGTREAVERTLNGSIQGTLVVDHPGQRGSQRPGWRPDLPNLTIHAEELGRVQAIGVGVDYEEGHRVLTGLIMEASNHLPSDKADTMWHSLQEAGYTLVKLA